MLTLRQLCRVMSAYLGRDLAPYAAALVRAGRLPRPAEVVDAGDAGTLLAAALAAPAPSLAVAALEALSDSVLGPATIHEDGPLAWVGCIATKPLSDRERVATPLSAVELLVWAIETGAAVTDGRVEVGGASTEFRVNVLARDGIYDVFSLTYCQPIPVAPTGPREFRRIGGDVIAALADALRSTESRPRPAAQVAATVH